MSYNTVESKTCAREISCPHKKRMRKISIHRVNVLAQMRQTFATDELKELAGSIEKKGVLNAPIIALFNRTELESYLSIINKLWNRQFTVDSQKSCRIRGKKKFYILLAGERRLRSYLPLVISGKKSRFLQMVVHEHLNPYDAVEIQFSENSHRRVPPHEEAHAYAQYWALLDVKGQKPTLSDFSRRVGRSSGAVKSALMFVSLPDVIRNAVAGRWGIEIPNSKLFRAEKLRLSYGIAVQLARLSGNGTTEDELIQLMIGAVIGGTKVEQFRERVSRQISNGHQDMFDLMFSVSEKASRLIHRRRTVESGISRILASYEAWFAKVLVLYERGHLGKSDSLFANGSVRQRMVRVAELFEKTFLVFYKKPPKQARKRLEIVRSLKTALTEIQEQLPLSEIA